eukprot:2375222-Prymnesium_polylepis.1
MLQSSAGAEGEQEAANALESLERGNAANKQAIVDAINQSRSSGARLAACAALRKADGDPLALNDFSKRKSPHSSAQSSPRSCMYEC